jgi:hypothetical protein
MNRIWILSLPALLLIAACGASSAESLVTTTEPTVTTVAPTTTAAPTTTLQPTTTITAAADAAPPELYGTWRSELPWGEGVFLSLTGTSYTLNAAEGGAANGAISVDGQRIRFYDGYPQLGDGFYEWRVDGETLTFTELEPPDEVGGRRTALSVAYSR